MPMRSRSSLALGLGFGVLLALIAVLGLGAMRRAGTIYGEMESTHSAYLETEGFRRDISSDMYLADVLVRDFLLDPSPNNARGHREQLLQIRASLQERLNRLEEHLGGGQNPNLRRLNEEVQGYWESLDPIFDWTPQEKAERSWGFLRRKVLPRREAVAELGREIGRLNREALARERARIGESEEKLHSFLGRMVAMALVLGVLASVATTFRVATLEEQHDRQRQRIQKAENDLRDLSRSLVSAQEAERKSLSRELHDEVGQTLTALGMGIANLAALRSADPAAFSGALEEAKRLNAGAMRSIRDLAMGLRPSMLDDLGLEPALQWQVREFSRYTNVPAKLDVKGELHLLDDAQRTCIYRMIQEALTNCARHANATEVQVLVYHSGMQVSATVRDNGNGFAYSGAARHGGLGLLGMRERVEAVDGTLVVTSAPGKGTTIQATIPVEHAGNV